MRGRRWVVRPPSRAAKVSQQGPGSGPGSQPPAGPGLPPNSGWGLRRTGSSSAPAGRGFPRRKPGGALAAGAAGRGRRRPAAEGSTAWLPRPAAPPHILSSPHAPKFRPKLSPGKPFHWRNGALRRGHSKLEHPRRVALFWGNLRRRPFSRLPGGTGWVPCLRRRWVARNRCGAQRSDGRVAAQLLTQPSPPPPAGDPTAPEAAVADLPFPVARTTNGNLRPRPLAEANAQPNLLTGPPWPSRSGQ